MKIVFLCLSCLPRRLVASVALAEAEALPEGGRFVGSSINNATVRDRRYKPYAAEIVLPSIVYIQNPAVLI
jgi:hypothetical protein